VVLITDSLENPSGNGMATMQQVVKRVVYGTLPWIDWNFKVSIRGSYTAR
jgi:hypothetical protein